MSLSRFVPVAEWFHIFLSDTVLTSRFSKSLGMKILFSALCEACHEFLIAILFRLSAEYFVTYFRFQGRACSGSSTFTEDRIGCKILTRYFLLHVFVVNLFREFVIVASPATCALILSSFITLTFQGTWYKSMKWTAETSFTSPRYILLLWSIWSITNIILAEQVWINKLSPLLLSFLLTKRFNTPY